MRDITNNRYREICVDAYEEIVQITEEYNKLFDLPALLVIKKMFWCNHFIGDRPTVNGT